MRRSIVMLIAALMLAACGSKKEDPYRDSHSNPGGSPSDRTGGSRPGPDEAGGK